MKNCTLRVEAIRTGERARKALGDLQPLIDSITTMGLLHPIVVAENHALIAGHRRLEAVKALEWSEVPVTIVEGITDAVGALKAERDENTCRLDFRPTEAVALGMRIEALEQWAAKKRQGTRTDLPQHCGKIPQGSKGKTRDLGRRCHWPIGQKLRTRQGCAEGCTGRTTEVRDFAYHHG